MSAVSAIDFPRGDTSTIYRMCPPGHSFLALAMAAPYGGALADQGLFQRPAAVDAGGAAATVGGQLLLEVAGCAVGSQEVAQGGAAALDRSQQDRLHRVGQRRVARPGYPPGRTLRRDA